MDRRKPFDDSASAWAGGCAAALLLAPAFAGVTVDELPAVLALSCPAGCEEGTRGELVVLILPCGPGPPGAFAGGGGNGAMPTLFFSFAAAAAAALAYFRPSPANLLGTAAGFI